MDREVVPEVVVLLKENDCLLLKDICTGGGVRCQEKCCVENCELDHNNISNLLKYELSKRSADISDEMLLYISTTAEETFSNHDPIKDDVKLCGAQTHNKLMEDQVAVPFCFDVPTDYCCSKKELSHQRNLTSSEQIPCFSLSQLFNSEDLRDEQQNLQENPNTETILADSWSGKAADCRNRNETDPRSELDIIGAERSTSNIGPQLLTSDKAKDMKTVGVEQNPKAENICKMDHMSNVPFLALSLSGQTSEVHRELGSSRFSAASTPSGRLAFSGLISSSDSISLGSNGTASARSFTFPVLGAEWNESPVRMAEADRRRLKSSKNCGCWKMCFTGSKF